MVDSSTSSNVVNLNEDRVRSLLITALISSMKHRLSVARSQDASANGCPVQPRLHSQQSAAIPVSRVTSGYPFDLRRGERPCHGWSRNSHSMTFRGHHRRCRDRPEVVIDFFAATRNIEQVLGVNPGFVLLMNPFVGEVPDGLFKQITLTFNP